MRLPTMIVIGVPAVLVAVGVYFSPNWQAKPLCHKQLMLGLENWLEKNQTTVAPNVNGRSADSLAAFMKVPGDEEDKVWPTEYRYVPGLQKGDPSELVLAYFTKPTRFRHHACLPTIFDEQNWIIVPLDFAGSGCSLTQGQPARTVKTMGECSDNVALAEFRQRLKKTLDFLRENNRPHWQTVVEEHTKFLDSLLEAN